MSVHINVDDNKEKSDNISFFEEDDTYVREANTSETIDLHTVKCNQVLENNQELPKMMNSKISSSFEKDSQSHLNVKLKLNFYIPINKIKEEIQINNDYDEEQETTCYTDFQNKEENQISSKNEYIIFPNEKKVIQIQKPIIKIPIISIRNEVQDDYDDEETKSTDNIYREEDNQNNEEAKSTDNIYEEEDNQNNEEKNTEKNKSEYVKLSIIQSKENKEISNQNYYSSYKKIV